MTTALQRCVAVYRYGRAVPSDEGSFGDGGGPIWSGGGVGLLIRPGVRSALRPIEVGIPNTCMSNLARSFGHAHCCAVTSFVWVREWHRRRCRLRRLRPGAVRVAAGDRRVLVVTSAVTASGELTSTARMGDLAPWLAAVAIGLRVTCVPYVRVIDGDRSLPAGFSHAHASDLARRIAERGLILRTQVGSGVHGTGVSGQDDRDEMGVCLEPPQFVTGLARVPSGIDSEHRSVSFEQYERHTVWDEPGGLANRSGAGDLDVVIYSARKWARLALGGNPTVLLV